MGQRTQLPVAVERAPDVPHSGGPKRRVPGTAACCGPVGRAPRHRGAHDEATTPHVLALDVELDQLRAAVVWLKTENERLLRLLRLSPQEAAAPGPAQSGMIDHRPPGARAVRPGDQGRVLPSHLRLPSGRVYATRWTNASTGRAGWVPAVPGGCRKGSGASKPQYLHLTNKIVAAHLSGELDVGSHPLKANNRCHSVAADFDGPAARWSPTCTPLSRRAGTASCSPSGPATSRSSPKRCVARATTLSCSGAVSE